MSETEENSDLFALGAKIREIRVKSGISQLELGRLIAHQIGRSRPFSQATISYLEKGVFKNPNIHPAIALDTLATVLGIPLDELAEGLTEDQIEHLAKRAEVQRQVDSIRSGNVGGAYNLESGENKSSSLTARSYRHSVNPVERLMLRRLERLLTDELIDKGIKIRLVQIINTQIDLIEDLK